MDSPLRFAFCTAFHLAVSNAAGFLRRLLCFKRLGGIRVNDDGVPPARLVVRTEGDAGLHDGIVGGNR